MGRRDFRKHETKKPKKEAKKALAAQPLLTPVSVEVVRKGRKEQETPGE